MKTETRNVYLADDGTEFINKDECEEYEAELKSKNDFYSLKAQVDAIECIECGLAPFGCSYVDDDRYEYRWYRPKNVEEVSALENFFHIPAFEGAEIVGEWVCIEIDGGYDEYTGVEDVYIAYEFENSNESLVDFYAKLGYDVEIKKKQSAVDVRDKALEHLWEQFEDVPMNPGTECIEQPFYQFQAGTSRYEIWKWFDKQYSKGVATLIDGG